MSKLYLSLYAFFRTGIREDSSPLLSFLVDALFYFTAYLLIPFLLIYLLGYLRIIFSAHIHEFNKEEDKDVRWVDILFASIGKGFVPFIGFLFLLFSIPFLRDAIIYGDDDAGAFFGIFSLIYFLMAYQLIKLIFPYLYFHLIAKKGIGIFGSKAIRSFVRRECGECTNKIDTISLGNSVILGDEGLEFKCSKCRNIKLKEMPSNISYGMNSSFDDTNVNPYWVIRELFKKIKNEKKSAKHKLDKSTVRMSLLCFLRAGVYGHLQAHSFDTQWFENSDSWKHKDRYKLIPNNCPECGYCIGSSTHPDGAYNKIKSLGKCTECNIRLDDMWQFRDSYDSDLKIINNFIEKNK